LRIRARFVDPSKPEASQQPGDTVNAYKLIVGTLAVLISPAALAGPTVPLGFALGLSLGTTLGAVLGAPLGSVLPIASVSLLTVAAVSLLIGIYIVRRKKHR
jgi:hypothetical protein